MKRNFFLPTRQRRCLNEDGLPTPVERARIRPPTARLGRVTPEERKALIDLSPLKGTYEQNVERESAYEVLTHGIDPGEGPGTTVVIRGALGSPFSGGIFAFIAHLLGSEAFPTKAEQDKAHQHAFDLIAKGVPFKIICGAYPSIRLTTSEEIRRVIPGTTLSEPRAVRSWRSAYAGPSIRIAKGLSFRFGRSAEVSESHEELRPVDSGTLIATTQRLVFLGSQRTISIPLRKLIEIKPYSNGIQVHRQDRERAELFLFDNVRVNIPGPDGRTFPTSLNDGLFKAVIDQATTHPNLTNSGSPKIPKIDALIEPFPQATLKSYRDRLAKLERLLDVDPANSGLELDICLCCLDIGRVLIEQKSFAEARSFCNKGSVILERMVKADPTDAKLVEMLKLYDFFGAFLQATITNSSGDAVLAQGKLGEALQSYREGLETLERLAKEQPDNAALQSHVQLSYDKVGYALEAQGNFDAALSS